MKPVYICNLCRQWTYSKRCSSLVNNHACEGTIQPYFAASDIEKLIKGRIEDCKQWNAPGLGNVFHLVNNGKIELLESLLSALEMGQKERNR